MKINLHIDRLVLDTEGARQMDTKRLKAAVEHELALLVESRGLPGVHLPEARSEIVRRPPATAEERLGRDLARRIHGAMKR